MIRALVLGLTMLAVAFPPPAEAETRFTDSAGRVVTVPDRVERAFPAGPPASVVLYVLAPDKLLGWSRRPRPPEAALVRPEVRDLPELGRLTGRGNTANPEAVLAARPDVIVDFGSVDPTYASLADRVQTQTGVPYVLIDGRFAETPAALRRLGRLLGVPERGERLAAFAEDAFARVDAVLATVPADARPRVYLARGPDGLETGVRGSINAEIIERAGAVNVADAPGLRGIADVSLERVLAWNPEVIVTWDAAFYESVRANPDWRAVDAVRNGRVYLSPTLPFGWIDRPPSVNRLLGLVWLTSVLYPERAANDLRAVTREFHGLFYGVTPTEPRLDDLLAGAGG